MTKETSDVNGMLLERHHHTIAANMADSTHVHPLWKSMRVLKAQ